MRARFIDRWDGPLLDGDRPDPEPGPREVLIDVEACGVGLTVLNCIRGDLGDDPAHLPRIPGHELVGTVAGVGPGADERLLGKRVMAYFYLSCGHCRRCLAGDESLCERLAGQVGVHRDGGYAERVALPELNVLEVPDGIDPVLATAIPDAIATPVHVARLAGIAPGQRTVVIAAGGGVGVHMVQVARLHGADVVALEASADKLAYLESELGVPAADSSDFERVALPADWHGRADLVIDLLGREESLRWSVEALGAGGRLVLLTTFPGIEVALSPREMVFRQLTVLGSRYASRSDVAQAAQLVAQERVLPVVSRTASPDDVDELHTAVSSGELLGRGALKW
jgi:D-arabinose 1-dehydrogenase-like Zn-dependent alcohol dehydrogenase